MKNNSQEVEKHLELETFRKKERRMRKILKIEEEEQNKKIPIDERDRVLNKVRKILEKETKERLNENEEEILKEIAGVYFATYKKAIEVIDSNELGGIENER